MKKNILMLVLALMLSACGSEDESQLEFYSALQHETEMLKNKKTTKENDKGSGENENGYCDEEEQCDAGICCLSCSAGPFWEDHPKASSQEVTIDDKIFSFTKFGWIYEVVPFGPSHRVHESPSGIYWTKSNIPGHLEMNIFIKMGANLKLSIRCDEVIVTGTVWGKDVKDRNATVSRTLIGSKHTVSFEDVKGEKHTFTF